MTTTIVVAQFTPVLHATAEPDSLASGHRFPRDVILLAVRYYLQLGVAAERIASVLADRGIDVSGRQSCAGPRSSDLRWRPRSSNPDGT